MRSAFCAPLASPSARKFADVDQKISLYQTNGNPGGNDADAFIQSTSSGGGVGISDDYAGTITSNTWYRLGIVNDLANQDIRFYLNGTLVNTVDNVLARDGRWSLYPSTDSRGFFLFGDNSGISETGAGYLGSLAVLDKVLSDVEINQLGGASAAGIGAAVIPESATSALVVAAPMVGVIFRRRSYRRS